MNSIHLAGFLVKQLSLSETDTHEDTFHLSYQSRYPTDDDKLFSILFTVNILSHEKYQLDIAYEALFKTDESITDEFKQSHFIKTNAPAIAYPYLRAFISTLTLNAGHSPILIPTVNFQALANAQQEQKAIDPP